MEFELQIAHTVDEVGQEAWDRLSAGRPFANYDWYRYGEAVLADDTPIYIILSHGGEPVARATFWLRAQQPLPIPSPAMRHLIGAMLHRRPLLMCETPLADTSGLILPDLPFRKAAVETLARVAQEQARHHRVSFLGCIFLEEDEAHYAGWPDAFAAYELPEPATYLDITWPDFPGYLKHLSYQTRRSYKRNCRHATDLGIEVKAHPVVEPPEGARLDEAVTLIENVEHRHDSAINPWARAMLQNAHMVDATWVTAKVDGHLAACGLLVGSGGALEMKLLGLDYDTRFAYFQVFYGAVRSAIEQGARVVWGGSGAYELKRKMGFRSATNNYTVFAGSGAVLQALGKWLAGKEENKVKGPYGEAQ